MIYIQESALICPIRRICQINHGCFEMCNSPDSLYNGIADGNRPYISTVMVAVHPLHTKTGALSGSVGNALAEMRMQGRQRLRH